jgi:antirestriction protein ArdC
MSFRKTDPENTARRDPIQEFADRIVAELERGVKPWVRPWDPAKCSGPEAPINGATGHRYSGINVLVLGMDPRAFSTGDPRYCTYKQAQEHHWQVRRGEKATTVFLYKPLEIEDEKAEEGTRVVPLLRTFPVFHFSQIDGVPPYQPPPVEECPWQSESASEIILKNSGVTLRIGGDRAFYSPATDHIQVPPSAAFKNAAEEATTRLHELVHASGAKHRLNRDLTGRFGSAAYAIEELYAELSSAFVGVTLNIPTDVPNHASYLADWLRPLKNDKRLIFHAAATAQRIADWILNLHPDYVARHEPERPKADYATGETPPSAIA